MNNQLYPFERNRYYPGKMLTTADFQAEQDYMINKNRFMNSLMYGAGIVCGLGVFSLDDLSILVESGVAIDGTGREIVVDSSVVRKLSAIEGFDTIKGETATLCVRFKEEPVHTVYSVSHKDSDKEYEFNRVSEGYELFLTDKKEKRKDYELQTEFLLRETIFKSENYHAEVIMPAIVSKGRNLRIVLSVKKLSDEDVRFSARGVLEMPVFATADGSQDLEIAAEDLRLGRGEVFRRDYWVKVQDVPGDETNIILKSGSMSAFENDTAVTAVASFTSKLRLTKDSPLELVNDEIGRMNLEMRSMGGEKNLIRLADIKIARTDSSYLIEEVKESGSRKHIAAPAQELLRSHYMEYYNKDVELGAGTEVVSTQSGGSVNRTSQGEVPEIATGVLEIPLGRNARPGDIRYSGEIAHGLGKGNVYVEIGYEYISEDRSLGGSAKSTIYGNPDLFATRNEEMVKVETAVRVLNDKGSFVVAARLLGNVDHLVLSFRWVAMKFPTGNDLELEEDFYDRSISAETPTVTMGTKESHFFGVQFNNMKACSITYELTSPGSGEISADGIYTAPAKEGVYEIHIYCTDTPVICTYAYAIVKRREHMEEAAADQKNGGLAVLDLESRLK
ncbi:MAG: hypothetical protein IKI75_09950 [Lachnospiraceae bacterium]|nr:hypothetical protein [Lachnospiraceae bacterium]